MIHRPKYSSTAVISLFAGLCISSGACIAQGQPPAPDDGQQMLSDVVPPRIGQFVERSGSDRAVDAEGAVEIRRLFLGDAMNETAVKVLRPQTVRSVYGPAELLPAVVDSVDVANDADPVVLLVAGNNVFLQDGTVIEPGGEIPLGAVVTRGVVLNAGTVSIEVNGNFAPFVVGPFEVLATACHPCEVTCGQGYFACCYTDNNGCPVCRCRTNTSGDADCQAGGAGATECGLGERTIDPIPGGGTTLPHG